MPVTWLAWVVSRGMRSSRGVSSLMRKGATPPVPAARQREDPAELIAVRALARLRGGIGDVDAGGAEGAGVRDEVVGLEAVVDEPAALLQRVPPAVVGVVPVERESSM